MERKLYLDKIIRKKHNGMVKVITGIRRCGKSYLLFNLFYNHLKECGIDEAHIIKIALDDRINKKLRNPDELCAYVHQKIIDKKMYYILLDEVQFVSEFEDVLNSFLHIENADIYATGSNAKFLSKDIITEFRGRGDEIHLFPFNFSEFVHNSTGDTYSLWLEYLNYGGLPKLMQMDNPEDKSNYLKTAFTETYIKDILERNDIRNSEELTELLNFLASSVGSLITPNKLSNTFKSVKKITIHPKTVKNYLDYFEDSFLITKAARFDVKGKKYISSPQKYYFSDTGLRNARLNFRQFEESHLMENVIFNELLIRGYNVDVGMVEDTITNTDKTKTQKQLEIDFVCNAASKRIYIQSALALPDNEKIQQEERSLKKVKDAFKKIIIAKDSPSHYTEDGILILNLFDFLLNEHSLEQL